MEALREPEDVQIECQDGSIRTYTIGKLPATKGRKLVSQYPLTAAPKLGDYSRNEELMVELMSYVEVLLDNGQKQRLSTMALIDNHVPDWEALAKIEKAMAIKNVSFFQNGKLSTFFESFMQKGISLITPILTDLLQSSSEKN